MTHLKLGYSDLENMPIEELDWFYERELKEIIDRQKEQRQMQG